jgi:hypothetical protein
VRRVDECDQPRPKLLNLPVGVGEPLAQVVVVLAESLRLGAKSSAIGEQVRASRTCRGNAVHGACFGVR